MNRVRNNTVLWSSPKDQGVLSVNICYTEDYRTVIEPYEVKYYHQVFNDLRYNFSFFLYRRRPFFNYVVVRDLLLYLGDLTIFQT